MSQETFGLILSKQAALHEPNSGNDTVFQKCAFAFLQKQKCACWDPRKRLARRRDSETLLLCTNQLRGFCGFYFTINVLLD